MSTDESFLHQFSDFTYFDNMALYYLCLETPPQTLALAFLAGEEKVCGAMLGILDVKRRKYVHEMMAVQKDAPEEKKQAAVQGMLIIADGLINRNLIQKKGNYFYGVPKS